MTSLRFCRSICSRCGAGDDFCVEIWPSSAIKDSSNADGAKNSSCRSSVDELDRLSSRHDISILTLSAAKTPPVITTSSGVIFNSGNALSATVSRLFLFSTTNSENSEKSMLICEFAMLHGKKRHLSSSRSATKRWLAARIESMPMVIEAGILRSFACSGVRKL